MKSDKSMRVLGEITTEAPFQPEMAMFLIAPYAATLGADCDGMLIGCYSLADEGKPLKDVDAHVAIVHWNSGDPSVEFYQT